MEQISLNTLHIYQKITVLHLTDFIDMEYFTQLFTYAITLSLAAILPGPGMTGLMFKTLAQGYKHGLIMLFGLITGDISFLLVSLLFVAYIHSLGTNFFSYLIVFSSLYLLYLAYQFWFFKGNLLTLEDTHNVKSHFSSYQDGMLISLTNPKTISFYLALVPSLFSEKLQQSQLLLLVISTFFILILVGGLYVFFSLYLKHVLNNLKLQNLLLKTLSILMGFLASAMLLKQLRLEYFS